MSRSHATRLAKLERMAPPVSREELERDRELVRARLDWRADLDGGAPWRAAPAGSWEALRRWMQRGGHELAMIIAGDRAGEKAAP